MKLLGLYVAVALVAAAVAVPRVASAQALGEAATLSAGVSAAGSGAGSALGRRIGGALGSEGRRMGSSGGTTTSGGVTNLHWSQGQRERYERTQRKSVGSHAKGTAKAKNGKAQPAFEIFGADTQDADSGGAAVSQPKPDAKKDASGSGGKN